jgi:hypothetical protein
MNDLALIAAATALAVYARAVQQLNVVGGHYLMASITPFAIAAGDAAWVIAVGVHGWDAVIPMGTGGAIGAVLAMRSHPWLVRRFRKC